MIRLGDSTDWYRCTKCKKSFLVANDDVNKHLLKTSMRCPDYRSCGGFVRLRKNPPPGGFINGWSKVVTGIELYQACAGVGLQEERKCAPADITKLLVGARVKEISLGEYPDPQKSLILSMTLENGKVLHLSASTKGALIYKVTELSYGR